MTDSFTPPTPLETAVLFLVFNRPDPTAQVFNAIRKAKPPRLYVAADGPSKERDGEAGHVAKVREIATAVDWQCELKTLFRKDNLGCKSAVSGAITWFFEHEEQGIILEDDCLPSQSFFWFSEALLEKYKNNPRIFMISGYNKQNSWCQPGTDYFFSYFGGIWGWASWRKAWRHYDGEMTQLDKLIQDNAFVNQMGPKLGHRRQKDLKRAKQDILTGKIDTWDYQWALSRHAQMGIACVPCKSLIQNIGFGSQATHTKKNSGEFAELHEINFPIRENHLISPDRSYDILFLGDRYIFKNILRWLRTMIGDFRLRRVL